MEVGKSWPFPPEWGVPRPEIIPDRVRVDDEAAARFMAEWASMQIRKRQRSTRTAATAASAAATAASAAKVRAQLLQMRRRLWEG